MLQLNHFWVCFHRTLSQHATEILCSHAYHRNLRKNPVHGSVSMPTNRWMDKENALNIQNGAYSVIMENKIMSLAKNRLWESLSALSKIFRLRKTKVSFTSLVDGYLSVCRYISKYVYEWYKIVIKANRRIEVNERVRNRVKEWEGMRDQYGQSTWYNRRKLSLWNTWPCVTYQ